MTTTEFQTMSMDEVWSKGGGQYDEFVKGLVAGQARLIPINGVKPASLQAVIHHTSKRLGIITKTKFLKDKNALAVGLRYATAAR